MPMSDFDQLPSGEFSAMNVNIAQMPYAVCSGAGGTVFFKNENMAKVYAAREINRGNELSLVIFKLTPVACIEPKSLDVNITDLAPVDSGSIALNASDSERPAGGDNNG